jgi:hypothetical protein
MRKDPSSSIVSPTTAASASNACLAHPNEKGKEMIMTTTARRTTASGAATVQLRQQTASRQNMRQQQQRHSEYLEATTSAVGAATQQQMTDLADNFQSAMVWQRRGEIAKADRWAIDCKFNKLAIYRGKLIIDFRPLLFYCLIQIPEGRLLSSLADWTWVSRRRHF